jgi:GntR family transcriptional repressor for pyruvate dehydrogenase complex
MQSKAYQIVIDFVKDEVLAGRLKQGQKLLPERDLAKKLNVSRTSVREALRVLEILGIIESVQGAGNYISGNFDKSISDTLSMMLLLQKTDAAELYELRESLELKALELAVKRITDEQINELDDIIAELSTECDENIAAKIDKELHYAIVNMSGNAILIQTLNAISILVDDFIKDIRRNILKKPENQQKLIEIHKKLAEGIKTRDISLATKAFLEHRKIIEENILC